MIVSGLLVAAGGFLGAILRYKIGVWSARRFPGVFPVGTLIVNLLGSFLLGLVIGEQWGTAVYLLLGIGFIGAFTTFSTFKLENVKLIRGGHWRAFALYIGISYTLGLGLAYLGYVAGSSFPFFL